MPTARRRGPTSLTTRPPKRISPASGRSKPAIMRRVVVLPHPEPPTSATSSPGAMSSDSASTASAPPKRLVRPRRLMSTSAGVLLQPLLDEAVLVLGQLHEVRLDEIEVRHLGPARGDVRAGDRGAAPLRVGAHGGLRHRPVEEALGVDGILGALHEAVGLERP